MVKETEKFDQKGEFSPHVYPYLVGPPKNPWVPLGVARSV